MWGRVTACSRCGLGTRFPRSARHVRRQQDQPRDPEKPQAGRPQRPPRVCAQAPQPPDPTPWPGPYASRVTAARQRAAARHVGAMPIALACVLDVPDVPGFPFPPLRSSHTPPKGHRQAGGWEVQGRKRRYLVHLVHPVLIKTHAGQSRCECWRTARALLLDVRRESGRVARRQERAYRRRTSAHPSRR